MFLQGTVPFMSVSVLHATGQITQQACHDLESMFYVMIYVFTIYKGPGVKRTDTELAAIAPSIYSLWFAHDPFIQLAYSKVGHMADFDNVIKDFTPYFSNLGSLMIQLRAVVFGGTSAFHCTATHDKMLDILRPAFDQLSDRDASTYKLQPEVQKRSRDTRVSLTARPLPATARSSSRKRGRATAASVSDDSGFHSVRSQSSSSKRKKKV